MIHEIVTTKIWDGKRRDPVRSFTTLDATGPGSVLHYAGRNEAHFGPSQSRMKRDPTPSLNKKRRVGSGQVRSGHVGSG